MHLQSEKNLPTERIIHSHEKPSSVWSRMKSQLEYKQHVALHPGPEITSPSLQAAWGLRAKEQQK